MHGELKLSSAMQLPVMRAGKPPLVAHVIYRLDVGGLENGVVNLINRIPEDRYRHAIVCLTHYTDFRQRIRRNDVPVFALDKPPGNHPMTLIKLWSIFRKLAPDIVHTRNLAALEGALPAALAGVPVRIHGEHGRDMDDLDGSNVARQKVRRFFKPFVHHYVALSKDLERYLRGPIRVPGEKVVQLYNGVDTGLFRSNNQARELLPLAGFAPADAFVIGTIGRMQAEKDPLNLARAFIALTQMTLCSQRPLRLVMIGDGPLRQQVAELLKRAGVADIAWLPGERNDVPQIMRGLDLFVLPSLGEGVSNTILEAMASGLPVVATAVGGNPELVSEDNTGMLVPSADPEKLAAAIRKYVLDPKVGKRHGRAARIAAEQRFGLDVMVNKYMELYDRALLARSAPLRAQRPGRA